MSGPIRQPLADVAPVTPTLNDKAVTIQNNTVRTSSYTAIYNLFKTGFDAAYLLLTGGTMTGNIDMNNNQIKGLGEPTENTDAATKFYVDTITNAVSTNATDYTDSETANAVTAAKEYTDGELLTKQNKFDYSGSEIGTVFVIIDDAMGGVAEFTQVINPRKTQYLRIQSNLIEATSKIICTLVYDGAGFPLIANQKVSTNRIDILVTNGDLQANGGATTDASIFIQYQIVG